MRITKIKDVNRFMEVVNECSGDVFLNTSNGDCLNLKSKLTQFIALSQIFDVDVNVGELSITANQPDIIKIAEYLVNE
jgi:hypothetical protein